MQHPRSFASKDAETPGTQHVSMGQGKWAVDVHSQGSQVQRIADGLLAGRQRIQVRGSCEVCVRAWCRCPLALFVSSHAHGIGGICRQDSKGAFNLNAGERNVEQNKVVLCVPARVPPPSFERGPLCSCTRPTRRHARDQCSNVAGGRLRA